MGPAACLRPLSRTTMRASRCCTRIISSEPRGCPRKRNKEWWIRTAGVHDLSNLFIIGGSVFPTVSWANPTFTLMALTFRLADHLRHTMCPSLLEKGSTPGGKGVGDASGPCPDRSSRSPISYNS